MKQVIEDYNSRFIESVSSNVTDNKMRELFCIIPTMEYDIFRRTLNYYAQKKYEEFILNDNGIPRNFYTVLENEMKTTSVLATVKKYNFEIELICDVMAIDKHDFVQLLNEINKGNKNPSKDVLEFSQRLKDIIRKFTSYYKENFIKKVTAGKMTEYNKSVIVDQVESNDVSYDRYIKVIINDTYLKNYIGDLIFEKLHVDVTNKSLEDVINATFSKNSVKEISDILGIKQPEGYASTLAYKEFKRLKFNYESLLNDKFKDLSLEEKGIIASFINEKAKKRANNENLSKAFTDSFKVLFNQSSMKFIEEIVVLMAKSKTILNVYEDGRFGFEFSMIKTSPNNKIMAKEYEEQLAIIKQIIRILYNSYKSFNTYVKKTVDIDTLSAKNNSSYIDTRCWINTDKFNNLMSAIDQKKISELTDDAFKQLKLLLNEKGLLWSYYSDNIDLHVIARIVNNFQSIYACVKNEDININNLQDIIRKANLYDYADEFTIGLLGIDVVSKIINYNQFSGIKVTDEDIRKRLRKAVDLSYRTEYIDKSSLPYKVGVKNDKLSLFRYKNNEPAIFTSGIDTQTCFFLSVNENDFFYYSLLNKNGFVIKILDKEGKFIARATCFRRNNALMINGIRLAGNKVIPENREEFETMKSVVALVETMSKKVIEITTGDECPIDFVVCNKAGILENSYFDDKYYEIDTKNIREPINIYEDDWQEFVHTYDATEEQMLQEVVVNPNRSFTTDFGHHYPAVMLCSRDFKFIDRPSDISLSDQKASYERPRAEVEEFIAEEIDESVLARVNRIKALSCIKNNTLDTEERKNYHLIKDNYFIKNLILGEDWYIIINLDNSVDIVYGTDKLIASFESREYINKINSRNKMMGDYSLVLKKNGN